MQTYRSGILLSLFALAAITGLVQWFAWIFGKGRFGRVSPVDNKPFSVAFSQFIFKIINEFRHLLALLVFTVFSFALAYSLVKAASLPIDPSQALLPVDTASTAVINNMKEALQAVMATLGGLVGSIIGYYFGESSAGRGDSRPLDTSVTSPEPAVQDPPISAKPAESITPVKPPFEL